MSKATHPQDAKNHKFPKLCSAAILKHPSAYRKVAKALKRLNCLGDNA